MYGNYNPYSYGYVNPMSQRLAELQQQQVYPSYPPGVAQGPQNVSNMKGRIVSSIEEARAAQVDLDGSTTYFASPGEGKIYAKSIGMNGLPVFNTYALCDNQNPKSVDNPQKNDLECRIHALEEKVKELTNREQCTTVSDVTTAGQ